uniref:Uncharacterized protein n=1 Tax=candidate division WWE3 bacterium TaxID=2053526 RepID=A0A7C4TLE8_UNCKA
MEGTLDEVSVEGLLHAMIGINYWALQDGQLHPAALLILNNLPEIERAIKQGWKLHTATIKRR